MGSGFVIAGGYAGQPTWYIVSPAYGGGGDAVTTAASCRRRVLPEGGGDGLGGGMQTGGVLDRLSDTQTSVPMQHVEPQGFRPVERATRMSGAVWISCARVYCNS